MTFYFPMSLFALDLPSQIKTHYGIGYEQRMILLNKEKELPSRTQNNSISRIEKIERPVRPYRPQRPIRPGR